MENIKETPLCEIAYKYGTDKCPRIKHNYTPFYYELLKDRQVRKVLEMGIGYYENIKYGKPNWDKNLKRKYHKGASLKMWRDFLPEAIVYGVDLMEDTMFEDDRIKTFVYDERDERQMVDMIKKVGSDIDLFIDDGSHYYKNQINLAKFILPMLDKGAIYIIEDVVGVDRVMSGLSKFFNCESIDLPNLGKSKPKDDHLILVSKK